MVIQDASWKHRPHSKSTGTWESSILFAENDQNLYNHVSQAILEKGKKDISS